jgi:hypothetical protein
MPFAPGESGNPAGRPKGSRPVTQQLIAALNENQGDATKLRRVVNALIGRACEGDVQAIKEILDRVDGKVPQPLAGADGEGPVSVLLQVISGVERTG